MIPSRERRRPIGVVATSTGGSGTGVVSTAGSSTGSSAGPQSGSSPSRTAIVSSSSSSSAASRPVSNVSVSRSRLIVIAASGARLPGVGRGGALGADGAGDVARPGARLAQRPAGAAEGGDQRRPGEQQDPREHQQDDEDVRTQPLEERGGRPVQPLADRAAVGDHELLLEVVVADRLLGPEAGSLGGVGEQQRREHQDRARVEGRGRLDEGPRDQRGAPGAQRQRDDGGDLPEGVFEPVGEPAPDPPPVPAQVEDEGEVEGGGDQDESDHVQVALPEPLHELARVAPRAPGTRRRPAARGGRLRASLRRRLLAGEDHVRTKRADARSVPGSSTGARRPLRARKRALNIRAPRGFRLYPLLHARK